MKQRVRVRRGEVRSDFRTQSGVHVQARVARKWVTVSALVPSEPTFEDQLAEAVAKAERVAASIGAWT